MEEFEGEEGDQAAKQLAILLYTMEALHISSMNIQIFLLCDLEKKTDFKADIL